MHKPIFFNFFSFNFFNFFVLFFHFWLLRMIFMSTQTGTGSTVGTAAASLVTQGQGRLFAGEHFCRVHVASKTTPKDWLWRLAVLLLLGLVQLSSHSLFQLFRRIQKRQAGHGGELLWTSAFLLGPCSMRCHLQGVQIPWVPQSHLQGASCLLLFQAVRESKKKIKDRKWIKTTLIVLVSFLFIFFFFLCRFHFMFFNFHLFLSCSCYQRY